MKIKLRDRWDDLSGTGERYVELKLNKAEACCVKETVDGFKYVMECYDGNDVYSDIGGADYPLRKLTAEETKEVLAFASEQFVVEDELNKRFI